MKNILRKILFLFLFGFIFRFLINSGYISTFCYLPVVFYLLICDYQPMCLDINPKVIVNVYKNNNSNFNSNPNLLRESAMNSENKASIFNSLKKFNIKFSNKYHDILHKINLQKKTFL
jgi:hypothetical protein